MAKYRTLTKTFIAPQILEEGTVFTVDESWEPGPHVEPIDEEAKARYDAYVKSNPNRNLHPIEDLPNNGPDITIVAAEPTVGNEVNLMSPAEANASSAPPKDGNTPPPPAGKA